MRGDVLTVERVVPAPPEAIFALVANTTRHAEIDGSGTVMRPKAGTPERLSLGTTFGNYSDPGGQPGVTLEQLA